MHTIVMYVGVADESAKYTDCESETVGVYDEWTRIFKSLGVHNS